MHRFKLNQNKFKKKEMKKFYYAAIAICGVVFSNAQVIDLQNPEAQVMDISNNGVAVGNLSGVEHFIFSTNTGGMIIGTTSGNGVAGNENISADGTKVSATVLDGNGIENGGIYDVTSDTWSFLTGLGTTYDGGQSSVWGMSADGNHIAGMAWVPGGSAHGIKWDNNNFEPTDLGSNVAGKSSRANAVNGDGTVVVGWQASNNGFWKGVMWKNGVEIALKDGNGVELGEAANVSADGKTIIGQTADGNGYIWNETEGVITYVNPDSDYITVMSKISDDGKTAVGFTFIPGDSPLYGDGIIWTKAGGFKKLDEYVAGLGYDNQGITFAMPTAISPDGNYIGGIGINWDAEETAGFMIKLPTLATSNVTKDNTTAIYPNPVKDIATFKSAGKIEFVTVYNMVGQKVLDTKVTDNKVDFSQLKKGVYVVTSKSKNGVSTTKVIKD